MFSIVALLSCAMPYKATGGGSAQGAASRRRPLHPRALANKIAAARYLQLIPFGYRVGREVTSCKTRPQPTSMWAAPAFGERFSDFDATNTRAVCNVEDKTTRADKMPMLINHAFPAGSGKSDHR
ncbi:hypothetical protein UQ82_14895 [Shigella dysenteriae]|nr:hypothetical protein UL76_03770 [Shigella dysenteriae]RIF61994.1 hypothetical protein CUA47_04120 [Shigella dysenteriae]RIH13934.1 hypothetical protein UQ82_14895 [Shigella dysenteriae]